MASTLASSVYSNIMPFGLTQQKNKSFSFRHFNKHLAGRQSRGANLLNLTTLTPIKTRSLTISSSSKIHSISSYPFSSSSPARTRPNFFPSVKCSFSSTPTAGPLTPLLDTLKNLCFDSLKETIFKLTPVQICKWAVVFSAAIAAVKWTVNLLFNPFLWMYVSWTWLFWPWFIAIGLAVYGFYCLSKHSKGGANEFEQLGIVTSAFTWLTLVPPAHFNGFLEGWHFVFFCVYHYFFFFSVSVRQRLYGDCYPREHDTKWDISIPSWCRILFCGGVMVAHWLAAFEGPELHPVPGGLWSNLGIWVLIMMTLFMQYHLTLYLAKYSEKVVVPTAVVQFGPYRCVRHPIYASTMLLFLTYFAALRAPLSSLFILAVCLMYYGQKAKLEESLMVENFGERYVEYMNGVRYKFIPLVY